MDQASLLLRKQLKGRQALLHDNQVLHDLKSLRLVRTTPHPRPFDTELSKQPVEGFSAGLVDDSSLFEWAVTIMGPPDTLYEGGFFNAVLSFASDYPNSPPTCRFTSEMWHPNVYNDGRVCISILHSPGDDPHGYETASERWSPVQSVESIMISIISMLSSPNDESPANIDAAKQWRDDREGFRKKIARIVRKSQEML